MQFRLLDRAVREANGCYPLALPPTAPTVLLAQAFVLTNAPANRECLNIPDFADDREVHHSSSSKQASTSTSGCPSNYYSPAGRRVTVLPSRCPVTLQPAESKRNSSRNICAVLGVVTREGHRRNPPAKRRSAVVTCQRWRGTARAGDRGVVGSHSQTSSSARLALQRLR